MRLPRAARTGILTLAALTGVLWPAAPSMAAEGYTLTSYIGSQGTGNGQFQGPTGIAVNETTGDIYITDSANNRVQELNSQGTYIAQFNGGPEHAFAEPTEIAVDNSPTSSAKGDVYVYDQGHQAIDVFDSEGKYLRKLPVAFKKYEKGYDQELEMFGHVNGIAVDPSGNVWVSGWLGSEHQGGLVQEFNDDGSLVTSDAELGGSSERGVAVDSQGNIYLQNLLTGVQKYNPQLEDVGGLKRGLNDYSAAFAVEALTGNVFLDEGTEVVECAPFAEPGSCEVDAFGVREGIGSSEGLVGSRGIAVDGDGMVFATEYGEDRIAVFKLGVLPVARTQPASVVERKGATVVGTVKRGVQPSVYYVQYGVGGSLASSTTPVSMPGETEEEVHVGLTGLNAVTTYSYRVVVETESGVRYYGPVESFTTLPAVEGVSTGPALNVTGTGAKVTGALEANGYDAHYYFQYGAEGEGYALARPVLPGVDAGSAFVSVTAEAGLSRLVPNTNYHFRLVTTNELGVTYGQEEIFATLPVEPTAVVQSALLVGLHEATLSGVIDPEHSDTHYHFLFGTSTAYGQSLPAEEEVDVGSSFANRSVTMPVEGLAPGTTYHYALVASNSQGTVQSADQTFTTPTLAALLPEVATGAASEVSPNGASLSGTVDPRGLPTSYEFDLGTDTTYGSRVFGEAGSGTQVGTLSLSLQGLAAGTLYHYRLLASNKYGTVYGADQTFTTPGFATTLLASPVGAPLVPAPAFNPPSTGGAVTIGTAPTAKGKVKHKAKQKRRKVKQRDARKAGRTDSGGHGNRRGGR
jgi:hypothetical protein